LAANKSAVRREEESVDLVGLLEPRLDSTRGPLNWIHIRVSLYEFVWGMAAPFVPAVLVHRPPRKKSPINGGMNVFFALSVLPPTHERGKAKAESESAYVGGDGNVGF
jgi:hypothetical protein